MMRDASPIPDSEVDQEIRLIGKVALFAFFLNLGLAIMKTFLAFFSSSLAVKAIVEAHGGKVLVESEMGTGSTFTVVLPLSSSQGAELS